MRGLIVKTHNRFYQVKCEAKTYLCSPKGIFRQKEKNDPEYRLPVIGDYVEVDLDRGSDGVDGYITRIEIRENRLLRSDADGRAERVMAANLDRILVVSAVIKPGLDFGLIDRYILTCELSQIPYALVINKIELDPDAQYEPRLAIYRALDVPIYLISAKNRNGCESLEKMTATGISYLTGASGVGKSTMINTLAPGANLATGTVDKKKGRGRHTTTFSTLIPIGDNAFLADSPGLRDFYPPKVEPEEVRFGFREIAAAQVECRFATCIHDEEPGCAVRKQVKAQLISQYRYKSYLYIMREMRGFFQNRRH